MNSPELGIKQHLPGLLLCCLFCWIIFVPYSWADTGVLFPRYPKIHDSVTFWEQIYSRYSVNSAVIHDRDDLAKVYAVVKLRNPDHPGAGRINSATIDKTRAGYRTILLALSRGAQPVTATEKKVAALFTGPRARRDMARAATMIRAQTGQKERFLGGVQRSHLYMAKIKKIFRKAGLPTELAYLPHVESSFNTKAYSKFGAAGIWQFTRATGKQYLQINDAVDERRDPLASAEAAARYLKKSHRLLGTWPLALTSYNYGISGMMRAKKALGSYEQIFSKYNEGHFGFASRNFYSEFLAALNIARRLENDPAVKRVKPRSTITYTLPGFISLQKLERHFSISTNTIRTLNPALRPSVYDGKKLIPRGLTLYLPVREDIRNKIASLPRSYFATRQLRTPYYTVRKGDTAGAIARKQRVSLKQLRAANSLDKNGTIYIGQRLRISRAPKASSGKRVPFIAAERQKQYPDRVVAMRAVPDPEKELPVFTEGKKHDPAKTDRTTGAPQAAAATLIVKEGEKRGKITVHPEESMALYAQWLKIPEQMLRRMNKLSTLESISPGQTIILPYTTTTAAGFADLRLAYALDNEEDFFTSYTVVRTTLYKVQQGDTIREICNSRFNIPLWLLKKYNPDLDYSKLHITQELTIPVVDKL